MRLAAAAGLLMLTSCSGQVSNLGGAAATDGGGSALRGAPDADTGPSTIAALIQAPPNQLVSDGTTLFWVSFGGPTLSSMPVGGGQISSVVGEPVSGSFLAVDSDNVYYLASSGDLRRAPKAGGGAPSTISTPGTTVFQVTVLGSRIYWVERQPGPRYQAGSSLRTAALAGGPSSEIADFATAYLGAIMGVTTTTSFVTDDVGIALIPLASGIPDGGAATTLSPSLSCQVLVSDVDAVYCDDGANIWRLSNTGTTSSLAPSDINNGGMSTGTTVAVDETYVYWTDATEVGTIMKVPKSGGATTMLARDTSPLAIAVDETFVYWSDNGGNIMRVAK